MDVLREAHPALIHAAMQVVRLSIWLMLLAAIFTPLERLFALHPKQVFRTAIWTDVGYYFLSSLLPSLLLGVPLAVAASGARQLMPAAYLGWVAGLPLWARITGSLLVGEVGFYWGHRWSHEVAFLWRFHAVHHSAEHMDYLVNTRAHPVDMVFTRLCGLVPLYVLGLGAPVRGAAGVVPALVVLIGTVWGFFIHANVKWRFGPLEWLVATPAFHHWHHTNDSPELYNKNYSSLLPWIDQVFGTLHLPKGEQTRTYGIDQPMQRTLWGQLMEPLGWSSKTTAARPGEAAAAENSAKTAAQES